MRSKIDWMLLFAFISVTAIILYLYPGEMIYDQSNFIGYNFSRTKFPILELGILPTLLSGIFKIFISSNLQTINVSFRIITSVFYFLTGFFLAKKVLKSQFNTCLFLILLFLSKFPFLWLSTELMAGIFLNAAIYSIISLWHPFATSLILILFGLTKPDLLFASTVILAYFIHSLKTRNKKIQAIASYLILFILINVPGIAIYGFKEHFSLGDRSMISFGQHYSSLVFEHQINDQSLDPWDNWKLYLAKSFPGAITILDIVIKYPARYFDFLALSLVHSASKFLSALSFLTVLLILRFFYIKKGFTLYTYEKIFLMSLSGLVPVVLFSYLHVRYIARYFPVFLIIIFQYVETLNHSEKIKKPKNVIIAAWVIICIYSALQAGDLIKNISSINSLRLFWFPD